MHFELKAIEKIVLAFVHQQEVDQAPVEEQVTKVNEEVHRIEKALIRKALQVKKDRVIEFYIRYHQEAIIHLIDQIVEKTNQEVLIATKEPHKSDPDESDLGYTLYSALEHLLNYIERHFSKFFNLDAKSPESYRLLVHQEIISKLPATRYKLERKKADTRLISIVFRPLDDFSAGVRRNEISYRKLIYLKELLKELDELSTSKLKGLKINLQICKSMVYLNYNSNKFYRYCTAEISRIIEAHESISGQIEQLAYFLKLNNQVQIKPGVYFHKKAPPIQFQLSEWISEEINYLEKRQLLYQKSIPEFDEPHQKVFKFRTDLSVAQVAFMMKMMMETGLIKNKNTLEVLRYTAGIIQTNKTENIAWGSLRSKYYHPEHHAVMKIKDMAIQFLNYSRKQLESA